MAIAVSLFFIAVMGITALASLAYFERVNRSAIVDHTSGMVTAMAESIDVRLILVQRALISLSAAFPISAMTNADTAQKFLDDKVALHSIFDNGLFLIGMDGKLVAESPFRPNRRGFDISFREFFKKTIETRKPYISKPYLSTHSPGQPAIIMTSPIFNTEGEMVGLVEGSFDLLGKNILADLAHVKLGVTGYLELADGYDFVIMHPDIKHIMKPRPPRGNNLLFDRAVDTGNVSGESVNSSGAPVLVSHARVASTGWILTGVYPIAEAYAPIYTARHYWLAAVAVGTVLMLLAVWMLMARLMAPLTRMTRQVDAIGREDAKVHRVDVSSGDEIGTLGKAFNRMLGALETQRDALTNSEQRFSLAVEATQDGLWDWSGRHREIYYSPRFREMMGWSQSEQRESDTLFYKHVHPDDRLKYREAMRAHLRHRTPLNIELRAHATGGRLRWFHLRGQAIWNERGRVIRMAGALTDIDAAKVAEENLWNIANFDSLTGLPNRAFVGNHLQHAIARASRDGIMAAVMILDIDKFKEVNDTLGHPVGDAMLREVGRRLRGSVRSGDWVARMGGDEYIVIIENLRAPDEATAVGEKILEAIRMPMRIESEPTEINVTVSIGITIFPADANNVDGLLRNADTAMYAAKSSGGGELQYFRTEMNERVQRRFSLQRSLRHALEHKQLLLYYQPQIEAASGALIGLEALLRLQDPQGNIIEPGEYISVAEETGLIVPVGEWVVDEACRQQKAWADAGLGTVRVAVNISARQFRRADIVRLCGDALKRHGLAASALTIELTESALMDQTDYSIRVLQELSDLGLHLSLDDFGTGYSSLQYLKRFPLDVLKIDRMFVEGLLSSKDDRAIASAIIAMSAQLGMKVVAEGVETEPQRKLLIEMGCDAIQGYLISRPVSATATATLLSNATVRA